MYDSDSEPTSDDSDTLVAVPGDEIVCPHCVTPISRGEHLCHECGGPITSFAMIDPLAHIWSMGYGYRQITSESRRPSRIALIGVWLIFVPSILTALLIPWVAIISGASPPPNLALVVILLSIGIEVAILYRVTHNYLAHSRHDVEETEDEENDRDDVHP